MSSNSTSNINFEDTQSTGTVTMYENPFKTGSKYFSRIDKKKVDIDNIIARMKKKDIGINATTAKYILLLFKAELIEALERVETIDLFGLGSLYIATQGTYGNSAEAAEIKKFQVKFTPSKESSKITDKIEISKITVASTKTQIETITDLYTKSTEGILTAKMMVQLKGHRLKVSGEEGGIYFAKCDEDGNFLEDETLYIKVDSSKIVRNLCKTLEFFLPEELESGSSYRIILKSNCKAGSFSKKDYDTTITNIVTIA